MASELSQNHFEVFGLPVQFGVDLALLSQRYRELQRAVHPDRYVNATDQERRLSVQRAAQINEAFQTLRDPLARARYLLALRGVQVDDERDTAMSPAFLMEQMELREALAEVREHADPLRALKAILATIKGRIGEVTAALEEALARTDPDSARQARDEVRKLQFLSRLREEALGVEETLE